MWVRWSERGRDRRSLWVLHGLNHIIMVHTTVPCKLCRSKGRIFFYDTCYAVCLIPRLKTCFSRRKTALQHRLLDLKPMSNNHFYAAKNDVDNIVFSRMKASLRTSVPVEGNRCWCSQTRFPPTGARGLDRDLFCARIQIGLWDPRYDHFGQNLIMFVVQLFI